MALIRRGGPAEAEIIAVTLDEWRAGGGRAPGLRLRSDERLEEAADAIARAELIELEFSKFTDGRPYSHARLLRERYRYRGELRAVGEVLRDQLPFMARCGFDAFEVPDADLEGCRAILERGAHAYQRAADGRSPIWALRARAAASERGRP